MKGKGCGLQSRKAEGGLGAAVFITQSGGTLFRAEGYERNRIGMEGLW